MSKLTRLRWLTVLAPAIFITVFEAARHILLEPVLPEWAGSAFLITAFSGGAFFFSRIVFGMIERVQGEILYRNQELSARNEVGVAVSEAQALDEMLGKALEIVLRITGAEGGQILVIEEESQELVSMARRGIASEAFQKAPRFSLGEGLPGLVAQSGEPVLVGDIARDPRFLRTQMGSSGFHSYAGTPLKSKNRVVGVMEVASPDPLRISSESLILLAGIGNQIGVAIENARLMERMRYLATLEERDRLGREIHDSFAQTLGYLNMQSRAIEILLVQGKHEQALTDLRQMGEGVRGAFTDVREAIFSLRTSLQSDQGLLSTLQDYFKEFTRNSGISVVLEAAPGREIRLSPAVQVQLMRIVQEALTNTRKYANATRTMVKVEKRNGSMLLSVDDNGQGFDLAGYQGRKQMRFGLSIMKERAESVGAIFSVQSQPGQGTRVTVELPGGKALEPWNP
ncbi:MAG: GAF domain-containing sensor histidine kinase [Dehalococcoidia bacterium]|nr:GAF domain-containing sensor histidine kinase [Dehalococcoidia bacterium]